MNMDSSRTPASDLRFRDIPFLRLFLASCAVSAALAAPLLVANGLSWVGGVAITASTLAVFAIFVGTSVLGIQGRIKGVSWVPKGEFSVRDHARSTLDLLRIGQGAGPERGHRPAWMVIAYSMVTTGVAAGILLRSAWSLAIGAAVGGVFGWAAHRLGLGRGSP